MKRFSCFPILALAVFAAFASCDKDSDTSSPYLNVGKTVVLVPYTGGVHSFGYKIGNVDNAGVPQVVADSSWIYDFDLSVADTVSFSVAVQEERVARSSAVTLTYVTDEGITVTNSLTVTQERNSLYVLEATVGGGSYYGTSNVYNNEGNQQFSVYFSDKELTEDGMLAPGGIYYALDLWTSVSPEGVNEVYLPEGEYEFGLVGQSNVFSGESVYYAVSEDGEGYDDHWAFVDGLVTVRRSSAITSVTATLTDNEGGTHELSYSGELTLENRSLLSSLEADYDAGNVSGIECEARYYGDYYNSGTSNWLLNIYAAGGGSGFSIDCCGQADVTLESGAIPTDTFYAAESGGASGTFLAGGIYSGYLSGTWLVTLDGDGSLAEPYAPLVDGTVEVSESDGVYTVKINARDDRGHNVTGTWSGVPALADYTTTQTSLLGKSAPSYSKGLIRLR